MKAVVIEIKSVDSKISIGVIYFEPNDAAEPWFSESIEITPSVSKKAFKDLVKDRLGVLKDAYHRSANIQDWVGMEIGA